jgi:phosphomannomutase
MTNVARELVARVEAWVQLDPDADTVSEAKALLATSDEIGLRERFDDRLQFGTAGLRGPLGAGPNRMNELVVRQTAAGLADYVLANVPGAAERGVVIGYDARHKSDRFAEATARVFAAKGMRALLFSHVVPTPVLAFAVLDLGVAVGVQVTASHNPPADNGYKVYWGDGPQIVPPLDGGIAAAIDAVAANAVPVILSAHNDSRIEVVDEGVIDRYHAGVASLDPHTSGQAARESLRIVYTAMHGVGGKDLMRAMAAAGFTNVAPVPQQFEPDPDFPTVAFPNPEEKGALDLAFACAVDVHADVILANDPDADRMAAAIPDATSPGGWRALRGDEIGWLLADHLLAQPSAPGTTSTAKRLVCTTIVSSSLLSAMAAHYGVEYRETLTGFKWLARKALEESSYAHVLSYEEALGYCVGSLVRDKDGISAALVMADLAASLKASGSSIAARLAEIEIAYGRFDTEQWSLRFDGADAQQQMASLMTRLRDAIPTLVAGVSVTAVRDLLTAEPSADVVILSLADGSRITVRPSGTEPKCKVYFETVTKVGSTPASIIDLKAAMAKVLGVSVS